MLLTMPAGLNALLDNIASNTRISVHNKAGIVYPMPYSFTRKVRQVDGVAAAAAMTWFGGAYEEEGRVTFPNFAVEADQVGAVYPDYGIRPEQLADFQRYRDGAIVGRDTMKKYNWKIGDRDHARSHGVAGRPRSPHRRRDPQRAGADGVVQPRVPRPGAEGSGPPGLGIAGMIWVRATDPERVNAIMRTIDELSRNSEAETACETEKSFFSNFFGSAAGLRHHHPDRHRAGRAVHRLHRRQHRLDGGARALRRDRRA